MVLQDSLLVILVMLVDQIPMVPVWLKRQRGHTVVYGHSLFLKALVIMTVKQVFTVNGCLSILAQPTAEMHRLRQLLTDDQGRFPSRRTWERRLAGLPNSLPAQIACLGWQLIALLRPWATCGCAAAIDSLVLRAHGGVWHKPDREAGGVPHSSIDTETHWTKSGWHGWVYGWKLHVVCTVAAVWIPLAAHLTPANAADNNEEAPPLNRDLPDEVHVLLGDQHYRDESLETLCVQRNCILVTTRSGQGHPYPHIPPCRMARADPGVEVRRILHKTRSLTIENFNEQFKGIFEAQGPVPARGLTATRRFALGAVFVYQFVLLYRHQHNFDLRVGLKACLKAA